MSSAWRTMIRKILILIFISILMAGCLTGEPAEKGVLELTSTPTGAEIYLDNQYRGTTPGTITDIEPGSHSLEFRLKGYTSWKSVITVKPGSANYVAAMSAHEDPGQPADIVPTTTREKVTVTARVSREQIVVGDAVTFYGTATGTGAVSLTVTGPGKYANGVILETVKPDASDEWIYTWNPGTKIQAGTYTLIATDSDKTVSARSTFTVLGGGIVSVSPSSYSVVTGESVVFSGRCTTGAPTVKVVLSGPGRFGGGVDLGNVPVMGDQTWSLRYATDLSMPTGVYSVYVNDIPQTSTSSAQFTIGFAS